MRGSMTSFDIKYKHYCTKIQYRPGHTAQGKFLRPYLKVHLLSTHMHNSMCIRETLCENYSARIHTENPNTLNSAQATFLLSKPKPWKQALPVRWGLSQAPNPNYWKHMPNLITDSPTTNSQLSWFSLTNQSGSLNLAHWPVPEETAVSAYSVAPRQPRCTIHIKNRSYPCTLWLGWNICYCMMMSWSPWEAPEHASTTFFRACRQWPLESFFNPEWLSWALHGIASQTLETHDCRSDCVRLRRR